MVGMEIFFTITEWPLTEVATRLDLMAFSVKILLMALATLPESTIMESTTMSLASGSKPMCVTSISPRALLQLHGLDAAGADVQPDNRFSLLRVQTCDAS